MKMFLQTVVLAVIIVVAVIYLFFTTERLLSPTTLQSQNNRVCFGDNCFSVELAKSMAETERGLMGRRELGKSNGMFFIFSKEGVYPFWMRNTLIPLDIIWIDSGKKIVFISENAEPCKSLICSSINPGVTAKYVLEVNSGVVKELQLKIGDFADLKF